MDLLNQKVIHKAFGEGTIINQNENYITVSFNIGEKIFAFPTILMNFYRQKMKLFQIKLR